MGTSGFRGGPERFGVIWTVFLTKTRRCSAAASASQSSDMTRLPVSTTIGIIRFPSASTSATIWSVSGRNHSRSARAAELAGYLGELGAFADRIANWPLGVDPDALGAELREQGDPGRLEVVRYQRLEPVSLSAMANLLFGSSETAMV